MSVTKEQFLSELERELAYLKDGGTSYRVETAELAVALGKKMNELSLLADKVKIAEWVAMELTDIDRERLLDVSKFLKTIYGHLKLYAELDEDLKQELEKRKAQRGKLKLVPLGT
jgi:hypothetical protein